MLLVAFNDDRFYSDHLYGIGILDGETINDSSEIFGWPVGAKNNPVSLFVGDYHDAHKMLKKFDEAYRKGDRVFYFYPESVNP